MIRKYKSSLYIYIITGLFLISVGCSYTNKNCNQTRYDYCEKFIKDKLEECKKYGDFYYKNLMKNDYKKAFDLLLDLSKEDREVFVLELIQKVNENPVVNYALISSSINISDEYGITINLSYSVQYGEYLVTYEIMGFKLDMLAGIYTLYVEPIWFIE